MPIVLAIEYPGAIDERRARRSGRAGARRLPLLRESRGRPSRIVCLLQKTNYSRLAQPDARTIMP
jgi:hypothetical protein